MAARLLSVIVVGAVSVSASCRAAAPPTEDITVWQRRGAWTGRGVTQTEPFISDTGLLRLTWEAHGKAAAAPDAGTFRITLHSDVSGRPLLVAVDRHGPGHDVTYVTEDPRSFFLEIESTDLDWSVEVAEGIAATRVKQAVTQAVSPARRAPRSRAQPAGGQAHGAGASPGGRAGQLPEMREQPVGGGGVYVNDIEPAPFAVGVAVVREADGTVQRLVAALLEKRD